MSTQTASYTLYSYALEINEVLKTLSWKDFLSNNAYGISSSSDFLINFCKTIEDIKEEIWTATFKSSQKSDELVKKIVEVQRSVFSRVLSFEQKSASGSPQGIGNLLFPRHDLEALNHIKSLIEENGSIPTSSEGRKILVERTKELIDDVRTWEMNIFVKRTLLMQLENVIIIGTQEDTYTGLELKKRVKTIMGDFAQEFAEAEKKNDTNKWSIASAWLFAVLSFHSAVADQMENFEKTKMLPNMVIETLMIEGPKE